MIKNEVIDEDGEFFELDKVGDDELAGVFDFAVFDVFFDVFGRFVDRIVFGIWGAIVDIGVDEDFSGETFVFGFDWVVGAIREADFGDNGAGEHEAVNWGARGGISDAGKLVAEEFVDLHEVHAIWSGVGIRAVGGG